MKRLFQFVVFAPVAVILIALSVANRQEIKLSLDPFSKTEPWLEVTVPVFWLIFGCLAAGVLIGGMVSWIKQGKFRKEAREQRYQAAKARHEAKKIKQQASALQKAALPAPRG